MPQLNPTPWFIIFLFTWFVFLAFILPKVLAHESPNELSPQFGTTPNTKPWNWPW